MDDTTYVISREDKTPFQRWKLDSLDSPSTEETSMSDRSDVSNQKAKSPSSISSEKKSPPILPSEEQVEQVFQKAQKEGYTAGFQAGRSAGYQEGKNAGETEIKFEVNRIHAILTELDRELYQIDQQVAQDLLALALNLSKKMITEALKIRPEFVLPIVHEAIRQLPHATQHPRLFLHPDDVILVSSHLKDELSQSDWKICADKKIDRGGCRVDAADSEVDASLSTRWQRILASLGQENNWLE